MRQVFADAVYWIALVHRKDQWHSRAVKAARFLRGATIVTTEDVFDEFLSHFSEHGPIARDVAVRTVENTLSDPGVIVRPQSHQSFLDGLALYKARHDKGYSLTDCISMITMRQLGMTEVLSHDDHFVQEGFTCLF